MKEFPLVTNRDIVQNLYRHRNCQLRIHEDCVAITLSKYHVESYKSSGCVYTNHS